MALAGPRDEKVRAGQLIHTTLYEIRYTTPMKIGLVCPYDISRGGGVQEHVLAQAEELRRRGYDVKILTPRPRNYTSQQAKNTIFIGNSAKMNTPIKTSLELGISLGRDTVDDILAGEDFDLLHIHEPEVPVLGSQIVAKAICPVIATFHAIHPHTTMARTIEAFRVPYSRSIFSRIAAMTAVSDTAATFVREHTRQPVQIIPNGINLAIYKDHHKTASKIKTILYIGRLESRKGLKYLIKAFAQLPPENINLVIAGEGPNRKKLESFVKDHQISNIRFLGYVDESTKLRLLATADLFCSPALYGESFGIVLLEAMASGLVSVVGNNPGYISLMKGRGAISVVDPKDEQEFARRMALLLYDEDLRQLWQQWAKQYVQQFDYKKVVDAYEKLYEITLKTA